MRTVLSQGLGTVTLEQKESFCRLLLSLEPGLIEADDIALVEKLHPEMWKDYCAYHWDPPEVYREAEDRYRLETG
jgi:hypothetical protein